MVTSETTSASAFAKALRRLYFIRFAFAAAWAVLVFLASTTAGPLLAALLVVYPLFDAAAVLWQLRTERDPQRPKTAEWINVVVSVIVAVALGAASTVSIAAALAVWGVWAIGAGIPQLVTAIRGRRSGGQVPQMLSGGISVLAGASFLAQALQGGGNIAGVGGYAALGGVFFLVSAIRLSILLRKQVS
ncbi:membrane protein [Streptomonospora sediminis]